MVRGESLHAPLADWSNEYSSAAAVLAAAAADSRWMRPVSHRRSGLPHAAPRAAAASTRHVADDEHPVPARRIAGWSAGFTHRSRDRLAHRQAAQAAPAWSAPPTPCSTSASLRWCATSWPTACKRAISRAPTDRRRRLVLSGMLLLRPIRLMSAWYSSAEAAWLRRVAGTPRGIGLIGMLMGWWQVKLSSGCPLPGGHGVADAGAWPGRRRCAAVLRSSTGALPGGGGRW